MGNKKVKKRVKMRTLVLSLMLLAVLSYAAPAQASSSGVVVATTYAQVDSVTKSDYTKEYQEKKKSIKANYRNTVSVLKSTYASNLKSAQNKGDRIEARKKYTEGLKAAQQKMAQDLKEAKDEYKKEISS